MVFEEILGFFLVGEVHVYQLCSIILDVEAN